MKKLVCFLILIMAVSAFGDDTTVYTGSINGNDVTITFSPGPFGPGERGTANVVFSGNKQSFDYQMRESNDILFYDIIGLCMLIGTDAQVDAYQSLDIRLTRRQPAVYH